MTTLNHPTGSDNQFAPWNAPCTDAAEAWALRQLTGDDAELSGQTLAAFFESLGNEPEPLLSPEGKTYLIGNISNADLWKTMCRGEHAYCLAATKELIARYLADPFTTKNFDSLVEQAAEVLV